MATIALYAGNINKMPGLIKDVNKSVADYKSELFALRKKSLSINQSVCNLDDVISSIQTSSQTQEEKITSLESFSQNSEQFISDATRVDTDVADLVNKRKDDFYDKYSYLKPECERTLKEKWDGFWTGAGEWCKENWELVRNIVLAMLAVAAIAILCVITFGAAAVATAAIIFAVANLLKKFLGDVIHWAVTGEWDCTWQSYAAAIVGGAVEGMLFLTGNTILANAASEAISTFIEQNLDNIAGGPQRTSDEIWSSTIIRAGSSVIFDKLKLIGKVKGKSTGNFKDLVSKIPGLERLSGRGSFESSFKMVLTKLSKRGVFGKPKIKNISFKTIRNGLIYATL